jgi:negative regulator of replication initiation
LLDSIKHLLDRLRTLLAGDEIQRRRSVERVLRLTQPAMRLARIAEHAIRQSGDSIQAQCRVGFFSRCLAAAMT